MGRKQNAKPTEPEVSGPPEWEHCINALGLSARQAGIIRMIFRGKKDKQIALEMGLSIHTVRTYLKRIFDRFEVSDRTALVLHVLTDCLAKCPHEECPYKQ